MEFVFVSSCHLVAALSVFSTEVWRWPIIAAVLGSFLVYFRDRVQTFYRLGRSKLQPLQARLLLTQQCARLDHRGRVHETALPSVRYMSEFLIVLRFPNSADAGSEQSLLLVLWPDSLKRDEASRLRSYLRFELARSL